MKRDLKRFGYLRRSEIRSFVILSGLGLAIWGLSFIATRAGAV